MLKAMVQRNIEGWNIMFDIIFAFDIIKLNKKMLCCISSPNIIINVNIYCLEICEVPSF